MQISLESLNGLERKLTLNIPSDRIDPEIEKRLKDVSKRVKIDGFRPGKVPFNVVRERYQDGIEYEVINDVINSSFQEAVTKEKIRPAGAPAIDLGDRKSGEDLECVATFEVYPEVVVTDLSGKEITLPSVAISSSDVDEMVENLRKQRTEWKEVDRKAEDGDQLMMDFLGKLDGEPFEGGKAENSPLVLGSKQFIPGFEEQLVGVAKGNEKTISVKFPDDYRAENLAGKDVEFDVTVHTVSAPELPEINEELIKSFGIESGKKEDLASEIEESMQKELDTKIAVEEKRIVMDFIADNHELTIPKALIDQEIKQLHEQAKQSQQEVAVPEDNFEEQATKRVKLGLILGEIIRNQELKAKPEVVDAIMLQTTAGYQQPEQLIEYYRSNPQQMAMFETLAIEKEVVEWIKSTVKVANDTHAFNEYMNPA